LQSIPINNTSHEKKLFSQSFILTIGTTIWTISMFLFKIIFYQKSDQSSYSLYLLGYSLFQFYRTIGFLNIGSPLSNDINKHKNRIIGKTFDFTFNGAILILLFSLIADFLMIINMFLMDIDWSLILFFCIAMITSNITNLLIAFYRGLEKIGYSTFLFSLTGILKVSILFILSFFVYLDNFYIALAFLIGDIFAFIVVISSFVRWSHKNKIKSYKISFRKEIFTLYIKQCFSIVLMSLCTYGIRSLLYIFIELFVSIDMVGFIDVPLTISIFLLSFFINIGAILTLNNTYIQLKDFYKTLFFKIILPILGLIITYEIFAYFLTIDDTILEFVFNLDGSQLAYGVAINLTSLPFLIIYYIINGYQQGLRKYRGILVISIISFFTSVGIIFILVRKFGLVGAYWSLTIYGFLLCILSLLVLNFNKFQEFLYIRVFKQIEMRLEDNKKCLDK